MNSRQTRTHPKLKPLLLMTDGLGVKVVFTRKISWWLGYYDCLDKRIVVVIRDYDGRFRSMADIAFILAHEIRHAQHNRDGLYRVNLIKSDDDELNQVVNNYYADIAYEGELDCDRYAKSYVDRFFEPSACSLRDRVYPRWKLPKPFLRGQDLEIRDRVERYYAGRK